jgi:glycosidase
MKASLRSELTAAGRATKLRAVVRYLAFLSLALLACGDSATKPPDYGYPPDANIFNPGDGGNGGGYDSSVVQGFVCPPDLERCAHDFQLAYSNESSVEVRGDFGGAATWSSGVPMTRQGSFWVATVDVPYNKAVQYKYFVNGSTWTIDASAPTTTDGTNNTNNLLAAATCDPALCDSPPDPPPGVFDWRSSVMYFVFVDRFFNGNAGNDCHVSGSSQSGTANGNYEGGDWAGVTQKIDAGYFEDLGVNTLWVTVPVKNEDFTAFQGTGGDNHYYSGYHGYWPYDMTTYEPCFGTQAELQSLVTEAHKHGLKVLFDFAMVQVTIDSPLYTNNPSWFWPNQYNGGDCICGQNCDWNAQGLQCWFASYLPHWNYTVQAARDYSVNAAISLAKTTNADGFRLDAIKQVDTSWLLELRTQVQSQIVPLQTPQQRFYMVGETYDFYDTNFIKTFVDPTTQLDGQFDFPARRNIVDTMLLKNQAMSDLANFYAGNDFFYGSSAVMSPFLGNHDLPRVVHLAQEPPLFSDQADDGKNLTWSNQPSQPTDQKTYDKLANAFAVLFTNQGAPLIYYGDEYGMAGAGDPDNRRFMQWSNYNAGQQYLHDRVKTLLGIRSKHAALYKGIRTTISATQDTWLFVQETPDEQVYVGINRGDSDAQVSGLPAQALQELVTNASSSGPNATVPARQTRIWIKQ